MSRTIKEIEYDLDVVNEHLSKLRSYIADDKEIMMHIELSKIITLEKKFYLLAELRQALKNKA